MYGGPDASRFHPKSPYATAKLFAHHTVRNYRDAYGLYACSGIMFNHESPIRPPHYVTRKITQGMAMISQGKKDRLVLGNLDARRDFGYAAEYVEAMHLMLQQPEPKDYVIATGETHSIREFVEVAGRCVGFEIEWRGFGVEEKGYDKKTGRLLVEVSADLFRPSDVPTVHGYPRKIYIELGWRAKVRFDELVALMVESDLERVD
jgi:GDPmannose 4,6-dehydratase